MTTPEEALNYPASERTRYRVKIEIHAGREPCTPGTITIAGTRTLIDTQLAYMLVRDESGLGGSQFGSGEVYDEQGQHIARISYNGRLWAPVEWSVESVAIAEAPPRDGPPPEFGAGFKTNRALMEV